MFRVYLSPIKVSIKQPNNWAVLSSFKGKSEPKNEDKQKRSLKMKTNREIAEFNNSKKNRNLLKGVKKYVFVSCPDFSHENGSYTYRSMGSGLPLSFLLAKEYLMEIDSNTAIFISDHEAFRSEVIKHLKTSQEEMCANINKSLEMIRTHFPNANNLSSAYSYERVEEVKLGVIEDDRMTFAMIMWSNEGKSKAELQERYKEKYAQMFVFLEWCSKNNFCAILLYSKFTLNLVGNIRRQLPVPVIFLDVSDPH